MDSTEQKIIALIMLWAEHKHKSVRTISRLVTGSGDMYDRLQSGHTITTRRANKILQWFSDHWPVDLPWPSKIERPPQTSGLSHIQSSAPLNEQGTGSELNPLTTLNAKSQIAAPEAFCRALQGIDGRIVLRATFDQVVRQYADGRPRAETSPRKHTNADCVLKRLVKAGDARFTRRIEQQARHFEIAKKFGLV